MWAPFNFPAPSPGPGLSPAPKSHISEITMADPDEAPSHTGQLLAIRRPAAQQEVPRNKRVAVPSANRQTLDEARQETEYANHVAKSLKAKHIEAKARCHLLEQKNTDLQQTLSKYERAIETLQGEIDTQNNDNASNEKEMAEQILHDEEEKDNLRFQIASLSKQMAEQAQAMKSAEEQFEKQAQAITSAEEQFEKQAQAIKFAEEQFEKQQRILSERETEVLALRQRFQRTQAYPSSPDSTPPRGAAGVSPPPSRGVSMGSNTHCSAAGRNRRTPVLSNAGPALPTVLLAPPRRPSPSPMQEDLDNAQESTLPPLSSIDMPDTFRMIVQETLRQLGVQEVEVSGSPGRNNRRSTGRSAQAQRSRAVKAQQSEMDGNVDKKWKDAIREFWRQTYNIRKADDFSQYTPAASDQVSLVNNGANLPDDVIELDFARGYEKSRWNNLILRKHYQDFIGIREEDGGWGLLDVSEGYLLGLFHGQLKRSRDGWAKSQPRFSQTTGILETAREAQGRAAEQTASHLESVTSRSRRRGKLDRRAKFVTKVIALKSQAGAPDLEAWEYFQRMLALLDIDGMSSEEEQTRNIGLTTASIYLVKLCPWRSSEITQYLKLIDQEAMSNPAFQSSRGSRPSPRFPSDQPGVTYRTGLPIQMYNPAWLREQEQRWSGFATEVLQVSKELERRDDLPTQFSGLSITGETPRTDAGTSLQNTDLPSLLVIHTLTADSAVSTPDVPSDPLPLRPTFSLDAAQASVQAVINNSSRGGTSGQNPAAPPRNAWSRKASNIIASVEHDVRRTAEMLSFSNDAIPNHATLQLLLNDAVKVIESAGKSLAAVKHSDDAVQKYKAEVIQMLRNLDSRITQLGSLLPPQPVNKAPVVVDAAPVLDSPMHHLDVITQIIVLLGTICHVVAGLRTEICEFIVNTAAMLVKLALTTSLGPQQTLEYNASQEFTIQHWPTSLYTALSKFNIEGETTLYAACPSCNYTHAPRYDLISATASYPRHCLNRLAGEESSFICGEPLLEVRNDQSRPLKPYLVSSLREYLVRLLANEKTEQLCDSACDDALSSLHNRIDDTRNVFDAEFMRTFQ
ncbi:hypothetical protein C0991_011759, partial [Blastosporella zonata]